MTTERHQITMAIDASGAQFGSQRFVAAITKMKEAVQNFDNFAGKAFSQFRRGLNENTVDGFAKSVSNLAGIRFSGDPAANVERLANAMRGLRGPSASTITNIVGLFNALSNAKIPNLNGLQTLASVNFASFKAPSATQITNLVNLMNGLASAKIPTGVVSQIALVGNALASFSTGNLKLPTQSQINSLVALFNALGTIKVPANMGAITGALNQINGALGKGVALGNTFRVTMGNVGGGAAGAAGGIGRATGSLRGLENAFSLSYQAGTLLRTLFSALTVQQFTQSVIKASTEWQQLSAVLNVTSKSGTETGAIIQYVKETADRLGLSVSTVAQEYGKFATATRLSGVSLQDTNKVFEAFGGAMRVMGLEGERQKLVFLALTQIFSKGTVSMEELRRQLGEQIPGTFELMAKSMGKTGGELTKMMQAGQVSAIEILKLADAMQKLYGPQLQNSLKRVDAQFTVMGNRWNNLLNTVGESGFMDALAIQIERVNKALDSGEVKTLARDLGEGLAVAIKYVGDAAVFAVTHARELLTVMKILAGLGAVSGIMKIFSILVAPLRLIASIIPMVAGGAAMAGEALVGMGAGAAAMLAPLALVAAALAVATGALIYFWDEQVTIMGQQTTVGAMFTATYEKMGGDIERFAARANASWDMVWGSSTKLAPAAMGRWGDVLDGLLKVIMPFQVLSILAFEKIWDAVGGGSAQDAWSRLKVLISDTYEFHLKLINRTIGAVVGFYTLMKGEITAFFNLAVAGGVAAADIIQGVWTRNPALIKQGMDEMKAALANFAKDSAQTGKDAGAAFGRDYIREVIAQPLGAFLANWVSEAAVQAGQKALQDAQRALLTRQAQMEEDEARARRGSHGPMPTFNLPTDKTTIPPPNVAAVKGLKSAQQAYEDLMKSLFPAIRAQIEYDEAVRVLDEAEKKGVKAIMSRADALAILKDRLDAAKTPFEKLLENYQFEIDLQGKSQKSRRMETEFRQQQLAMLQKGIVLNDKQKEQLRDMIKAWDDALNPTGFDRFMKQMKTMDEQIDDIEFNIANDLSNAVAEFVTNGTFDFKKMITSWVMEINKMAASGLLKGLMKMVFGGGEGGQSIGSPLGWLFSGMQSGSGGGSGSIFGGIGNWISGLFGGGGGAAGSAGLAGILGSNGLPIGMFKEGGISNRPTNVTSLNSKSWAGARRFAQGTSNIAGGIPAVLHPNEAVIPLSRGRRIPVEMKGAGGGGNQTNVVMNITTPDANSFRRSKQQIETGISQSVTRSARRNGVR